MSYEPNNFVHFFWASPKGQKPPLSAMHNLERWSRHLKYTEFLPILWCNSASFEAIQQSCQFHKLSKITDIKTLPHSWQISAAKLLQMTYGEDVCWCEYERDTCNTSLAHYPRQFIFINIETYFQNLISHYQKHKQDLEYYLWIFQNLNKEGLYTYAKDFYIPDIIAHFGGFYFDTDFRPKETAFPKNMQQLKGLQEIIQHSGSGPADDNVYVFTLIKFPNPQDPYVSSDGYTTDVGMLVVYHPKPFQFSSSSRRLTPEQFNLFVEDYQKALKTHKEDEHNFYLKVKQFPGFLAPTDPDFEHVQKRIQFYRKNANRCWKKLNGSVYRWTEKRYDFGLNIYLYQTSLSKKVNVTYENPHYLEFYQKTLFNLFTQLHSQSCSSQKYDGCQVFIERLEALDTLNKHLSFKLKNTRFRQKLEPLPNYDMTIDNVRLVLNMNVYLYLIQAHWQITFNEKLKSIELWTTQNSSKLTIRLFKITPEMDFIFDLCLQDSKQKKCWQGYNIKILSHRSNSRLAIMYTELNGNIQLLDTCAFENAFMLKQRSKAYSLDDFNHNVSILERKMYPSIRAN